MKAQLIIEKGQARLLTPVYLKPDALKRFEIEIPDDAVSISRDWFPNETLRTASHSSGRPPAQPGSLQEEINKILGSLAHVRSSASIGDDHQTLLDALEERYVNR